MNRKAYSSWDLGFLRLIWRNLWGLAGIIILILLKLVFNGLCWSRICLIGLLFVGIFCFLRGYPLPRGRGTGKTHYLIVVCIYKNWWLFRILRVWLGKIVSEYVKICVFWENLVNFVAFNLNLVILFCLCFLCVLYNNFCFFFIFFFKDYNNVYKFNNS